MVDKSGQPFCNLPYQRIQQNIATIGVLVLRRGASISDAIQELELIHAVGDIREFDNGVWYIPF
jgi:hypothetical protein